MPNVWSSATLIEADFSGIEAVLMGWLMRDPAYIRLAKLGIHAYLASHLLKRPADLGWSDADLAGYFAEIKSSRDAETQRQYAASKRAVHGKNYGLTVHGLLRNNPTIFRSLKDAECVDAMYCAVAPGLPVFHNVLLHQAHTTHFLGGAGAYAYQPATLTVTGHPYGYKHWFWSVVGYDRLNESQRLWRTKRKMPMIDINGIWYGVVLGEDAKRAEAFYGQSAARGVLTEAALELFDPEDEAALGTNYIGDAYYGETPLRAPIHDSLLLEVPTRKVDQVIEKVRRAMETPIVALPCPAEWAIGPYLTIGVDVKVGEDWASMKKVGGAITVAGDTPFTPAEEADEDEIAELEGRLGVA